MLENFRDFISVIDRRKPDLRARADDYQAIALGLDMHALGLLENWPYKNGAEDLRILALTLEAEAYLIERAPAVQDRIEDAYRATFTRAMLGDTAAPEQPAERYLPHRYRVTFLPDWNASKEGSQTIRAFFNSGQKIPKGATVVFPRGEAPYLSEAFRIPERLFTIERPEGGSAIVSENCKYMKEGKEETMEIKKPEHYRTNANTECWDEYKRLRGDLAALVGLDMQVYQYLARWPFKTGADDLKKAAYMAEVMADILEEHPGLKVRAAEIFREPVPADDFTSSCMDEEDEEEEKAVIPADPSEPFACFSFDGEPCMAVLWTGQNSKAIHEFAKFRTQYLHEENAFIVRDEDDDEDERFSWFPDSCQYLSVGSFLVRGNRGEIKVFPMDKFYKFFTLAMDDEPEVW